MKITYIHHSGFLVETENRYLLFDYYKGKLPEFNPEKPLYVFVSHVHHDHFDSKVFQAGADGQKRRYILSSDIPSRSIPLGCRPYAVRMNPHENWNDGSVFVETLASTDQGVAFWVVTDGKAVYHAGDLNDWYWDGDDEDQKQEQDYLQEMQRIKGRHADVAFVPVDPRLGRNAILGLDYFTRYVDASVIFPMHCWDKYQVIGAIKRMPQSEPYRSRIMGVSYDGETYIL